jgi:DNA-directed RNA polymerase subunit omega
MYEELKEEAIVRKVGGRFKLSTLIQKRLVQLNRGARPLIDTNLTEEIEQDKIFLDTTNQVRATSSPEFIDSIVLESDDM